MNYNQFYLTEDGQDLLNRTTQGARLEFTRVAVGNGVVKNIEEMRKQKALISQNMTMPISNIKNNHDGTCTAEVGFTNKDLNKGFYVNEIGVFASDPIKGEILYFIAATGGQGDFIPAYKMAEGNNQDIYSGKLVELSMEIIIAIGDVSEVIININNSMVFATKEMFDQLAGEGWTDETVKDLSDQLLKLRLEFASFKGATTEGLGKNSYYVAFDRLIESEEYQGVWDENRRRLGIYGGGN